MGAIVELSEDVALPGLRVEHGVTLGFEMPDLMAKRVAKGLPGKGTFRAQAVIDSAVEKMTGGRVADVPGLLQETISQLTGSAHVDLYATGSWDDPGSVQISGEMLPSGVTSLPAASLRPTMHALDPSAVTVACEHPQTGAIGVRRERNFVVRWALDVKVPKTGARYEYYLRKTSLRVYVDHYGA